MSSDLVLKKLNYRPSLVSFLDILGFRELLRTRTAEDIAQSLRMLRDATRPEDFEEVDDKLFSTPKWFQVSDAIVRVRHFDTKYRDGALYHELSDLGFAQAILAGQGMFVRGGFAIGEATTGDDDLQLAFGPALAEAYELESNSAVFPRIVISPKVLDHYKNGDALKAEQNTKSFDEKYVLSMVRSSATGPWLDYMAVVRDNLERDGHISFCRDHAGHISACLEKSGSQPRVMEKYLWLAAYHNNHVVTSFDEGDFLAFATELSIEAPTGWSFPILL
jgi:hypothetical protein